MTPLSAKSGSEDSPTRKITAVKLRRFSAVILSVDAVFLIVASMGTVAALYRGYWYSSHDSYWWPIRVVEYVQAWKGGSLYPRWCPDFYSGYGYPLFNYYQVGLVAAAAATTMLLGVGPIAALKLLLSFFISTAGLGVYGLVYGETRRSDVALISGFVYLFLPYRFTDLFLRGDLGEFAAFSVVPFALWGFRALGRCKAERRPLVGALTAAAQGATWFLHPLIGVILTGLLIALLILQLFATENRKEGRSLALFGGCVVVLGTLIATVYIAPAILERPLAHLENLRQFCRPTTKYLVGWTALTSPGFFGVGSPTLVGALILVALWVFPPTQRRLMRGAGHWLPWLLSLSVLSFLCMSLTTDIWFSKWFWDATPFGMYLLYPFRLLGFAGLFAAIAIGLLWMSLVPERWLELGWLGAVAVSVIIVVESSGYNKADYINAPTPIEMNPEVIRNTGMITTVVSDEFRPATATQAPTVTQQDFGLVNTNPAGIRIDGGSGAIGNYALVKVRKLGPLRYGIQAHAWLPGSFDLNVFYFPGWTLEKVRGPAKVSQSPSPNGFIRLSLPVAGDYDLIEYFGSTPLGTLSALMSLFALVLSYPLLRFISGAIWPARLAVPTFDVAAAD